MPDPAHKSVHEQITELEDYAKRHGFTLTMTVTKAWLDVYAMRKPSKASSSEDLPEKEAARG